MVQDTQDAHGMLEVYMDTIHALGIAIQGKPKKVFHLQKQVSTILLAVDESKRLLTVYASSEVGFNAIDNTIVKFSLESRANHPLYLREHEQQPNGSRGRNHHHKVVR